MKTTEGGELRLLSFGLQVRREFTVRCFFAEWHASIRESGVIPGSYATRQYENSDYFMVPIDEIDLSITIEAASMSTRSAYPGNLLQGEKRIDFIAQALLRGHF